MRHCTRLALPASSDGLQHLYWEGLAPFTSCRHPRVLHYILARAVLDFNPKWLVKSIDMEESAMALRSLFIVNFSVVVVSVGFLASAQAAPLPVPVQLHSTPVAGKATRLLTGVNGHTLYYFTHDTKGIATCTGSCADLWPPLLSKGPVVSHVKGISGTFEAVKGANGLQVDYNGHPLYYYAPDSKAGEALGNGLFGGTWWVATPNLAPVPITRSSNKAAPKPHSSW